MQYIILIILANIVPIYIGNILNSFNITEQPYIVAAINMLSSIIIICTYIISKKQK